MTLRQKLWAKRLKALWCDRSFRLKMVRSHIGYVPSEGARKKLSETWKRKGHPRGMLGKKLTASQRRKISLANFGHICSENTRGKISLALRGRSDIGMFGRHHSALSKKKISESNKGRKWGLASRRLASEAHKKRCKSLAERTRLAEFRLRGKVGPNKLEKRVASLLRKYFPGKFFLNVKGPIIIGGKIPDFVCVDKKLLLETFGIYWHSEKLGISKVVAEKDRAAHFRKFGYATIVVWETENKDVIEKKVKLALERRDRCLSLKQI